MSIDDVIVAALCSWSSFAGAADWTRLGSDAEPRCERDACSFKQGSRKFEVKMVTEDKDELTYLRRLELKDRLSGRVQTFETPAVNGSERGKPFELYRVHLQSPGVSDLALLAFNSAKAGPSYYYFVYDPKTREFKASESTIPKLVRNEKTKTLETDVQNVPFELRDHRLVEK